MFKIPAAIGVPTTWKNIAYDRNDDSLIPLNDVKSFIIYKGKNFKISGCWKVYDNVDYCIKQFNKFKKYRYMFYYLYENNYNIESLVLISKNMSSYIK